MNLLPMKKIPSALILLVMGVMLIPLPTSAAMILNGDGELVSDGGSTTSGSSMVTASPSTVHLGEGSVLTVKIPDAVVIDECSISPSTGAYHAFSRDANGSQADGWNYSSSIKNASPVGSGSSPLLGVSNVTSDVAYPNTTTTYNVSCSYRKRGTPKGQHPSPNSLGDPLYASGTVTITVLPSTLSGQCSPNPTSVSTNQSVTWSASASGGTGPYVYQWSGDNLFGTGVQKVVTYLSAGTKRGSVTVTDSAGSKGQYERVAVYPRSGLGDINLLPQKCNFGTNPIALCENPVSSDNNGRWAASTCEWAPEGDSVYTDPNSSGEIDVYACVKHPGYLVDNTTTSQCSAPVTVTGVQALAKPDLTASNAGAVSGSNDADIVLSGTVGNVGTAATDGSFKNMVQICDGNGSCKNYNKTIDATMGTLAAGASQGVSFTTRIITAGTYSYRMCADTSASWASTVPESNETNNCSGFASVTVKDANPPVPGKADLVPVTSPTIAGVVGKPVTINGAIMNKGDAKARTFKNAFFIAGANGSWAAMTQGTPIESVSAKGTASVKATFAAATFTAAGSYGYRYCADMDLSNSWKGSVDESNENNNCIDGVINMAAMPYADLTAGTIDSVSGTTGVPVTITVPISNEGSADSASFPVHFVNADRSISFVSGYTSRKANETQTVTVTRTFSKPGTYAIHACANENINGTKIVTESNYGNNCGPDTTITISNDSTSCSLSPDTLSVPSSGGKVNVQWNASNANSCTGSGFSTGNKTSGSVQLDVTKDTTLSLSCQLKSGALCTPPSATVTLVKCGGTPDLQLTAKPTRVISGESTALSWSASGTDAACTLKGSDGKVLATSPAGACTASNSGTDISTGPLTKQTVYTLSCGAASKTVIVNIVPKYSQF